MREIPLSRGYIALVDDSDYPAMSAFKWTALVTGKNIKRVYAMRRKEINGKVTYFLLHRDIMLPMKGMDIDHINHDTLDCRRENMRLATRRQNLANGRRKIGISGYRGVSRAHNTVNPAWVVIVDCIYRGTFNDIEDAARYYDEVAKLVYGEFATLNFP